LLKRVILTSTKEGDLVLDPVAGTGTTGYTAHQLKRNFSMVEVNPKYVEGIKERFNHILRVKDTSMISKKNVSEYIKLKE